MICETVWRWKAWGNDEKEEGENTISRFKGEQGKPATWKAQVFVLRNRTVSNLYRFSYWNFQKWWNKRVSKVNNIKHHIYR